MNEKRRTQATRGKKWRQTGTVALVGAALLGAALGLGCESQADPGYRGEPLLSVTGHVEAALHAGPVDVGLLWVTLSGVFDLTCSGEVVTASGEPSECVAACGEVRCDNLLSWSQCAEACSDVLEVYSESRSPAETFITGGIGQTTPAVGEFPSQFSLDILEPPPPEALLRDTLGQKVALGLFVALDPSGAPWRFDLDQPEQPSWLLGSSMSHFLVFAPEPIAEGTVWAETLGFAPGAGYQLVQLSQAPCDSSDADCREGQDLEGVPVPPGDASQVSLVLGPPGHVALPFLNQ